MRMPIFHRKKKTEEPKKEGFFARMKRRLLWAFDRLLELFVFLAAFRFIGPAATLAGFAVYFLLLGKRSVPERVGLGFLTGVVTLALQIAYAHWH